MKVFKIFLRLKWEEIKAAFIFLIKAIVVVSAVVFVVYVVFGGILYFAWYVSGKTPNHEYLFIPIPYIYIIGSIGAFIFWIFSNIKKAKRIASKEETDE